jgi:F-type H+-transporting ATPase subunit b
MIRARLLVLGLAVAAFAQEHAEPAKGHEAPKAGEPAKAGEHAPAAAHEPGKHGEATGGEHGGGASHGPGEIWKWANFALLAGGLGYMIAKNGGPFFAARTQQIRKDMIDSQEARRQAEARAAEVDRRLASIETAIAAFRTEAHEEVQAETERLTRHTAAEVVKIQANAEQEIASAGKAARAELKKYSAELAIGLAEQRIRARMNPETQQALVRGFVRDLEPGASRAAK